MTAILSDNVLNRIFCLGNSSKIAGTGTMLDVDGKQYLVTADHVAKSCGYEPQLLLGGWDATTNWRTIGTDTEADVAVLAADRPLRSTPQPLLEEGKIAFGTPGYALGFPADYGIDLLNRYADHGGGAYPMPAPVVYYIPDNVTINWMHFWGHVPTGFSGGPVMFPIMEALLSPRVLGDDKIGYDQSRYWVIVGIVLGYAQRQHKADLDGAPLDLNVTYQQPAGMIRVAKKEVFLRLIRQNPQGCSLL